MLYEVIDDCQEEIDAFAALGSGSVRKARSGRDEAIRKVCIAHAHVEAKIIRKVFDKQLVETLADTTLSQKERTWLENLRA